MQVPNSGPLSTAYERYGPQSDHPDAGAGYAAGVGAIAVAALYVATVWLIDAGHLGIDYSPFFAELEFHWAAYLSTVGLVFAVPSAFLVGLAGWRIVSPETTLAAVLTGGVGAVVTYLVAIIPIAAVLFIVGETVELAVVAAYAAFLLTGWLAVPVGCLVGLAYAVRRPTVSS